MSHQNQCGQEKLRLFLLILLGGVGCRLGNGQCQDIDVFVALFHLGNLRYFTVGNRRAVCRLDVNAAIKPVLILNRTNLRFARLLRLGGSCCRSRCRSRRLLGEGYSGGGNAAKMPMARLKSLNI